MVITLKPTFTLKPLSAKILSQRGDMDLTEMISDGILILFVILP